MTPASRKRLVAAEELVHRVGKRSQLHLAREGIVAMTFFPGQIGVARVCSG